MIAAVVAVLALTLPASAVAYAASLPSDNGSPAAEARVDNSDYEAVGATDSTGTADSGEADVADGTEAADDANSEAKGATDSTGTTGEVEADVTGGTNEKDSEADAADGETNPFAAAFETLKSMSTEILCALTFIGSMILAWAYKKGLLPLLRGGLGAISSAVSGIKESAESGENATRELTKAVVERLTEAEEALEKMTEGLDGIGETLDKLKSDEEDRARLKTLIAAQVEMLYDIFMTSSLPQYQKEAVGERIAKMKEALGVNEN